ncbi:hypothetical protein N6G02_23365 [Cupriavidus gilardii]|uniref:PIN-like domain-containing protein n=1 Tax=Cupriavidus gilardii TaxID=82541 RepID=UPI0021C1203D|nr:hypothetical protein [Cupriavidus gilardii]
MKFFVDNNLPPALARAMHALSEVHGHSVTHLRDTFPAHTADADWIEGLSREGG